MWIAKGEITGAATPLKNASREVEKVCEEIDS